MSARRSISPRRCRKWHLCRAFCDRCFFVSPQRKQGTCLACAAGSGFVMPLSIATICRRLRKEYGPVELGEPLPPLDELIATILSQNTSDRNSDAAFAELRRRLPTWEAVRTAPLARIVRAIRSGGLARQKAPRIRAVLNAIHKQHGALALDFLHKLPDDEALTYLRAFAGVGPKTAACV